MKEKIKELLLNDMELLKDIVNELNTWNGCLDWLEVYENDEYFFETFFGNNTIEAVRAVCYGEYNYCDDLVRINAYGNLESCNNWEYEEDLQSYIDDIIENLIEYKDDITIYNDELKDILNDEEE